MDKIRTIKNVITPDDAKLIIDYIDKNLRFFNPTPGLKRFTKMFGKDVAHQHMSKVVVEGLDDITDLIKDTVDNVKKTLAYQFSDTDDILLTSLWFAKQRPGGDIKGHLDIDGGLNTHFVYSAVLYLNTIQDGGELDFPMLNVSIKPELGDLVVFPSSGEDMFHEVKRIGEDRYTLPMWFTKDKGFELTFK